ncbi:MAG TPA: porin family protein [Gemmatimonadaceae bacterium]|nr:porin family protein [Gemmatimonadaceae bacterium]
MRISRWWRTSCHVHVSASRPRRDTTRPGAAPPRAPAHHSTSKENLMKRTLTRTLLAAAAIALGASPAFAQTSTGSARPYTIGVSAGLSIPTGDLGSTNTATGGSAKSGYNVNGILGYDSPASPFGVRAEFMYNSFAVDQNATGLNVDYSVIGGTLDGVFNLGAGTSTSGIRPYAIAGIDFAQFKVSGDLTGSKSGVGFNAGLGVKVPLAGFQTFAEARYHYVNTQDNNNGFGNATFLPISVGIMF